MRALGATATRALSALRPLAWRWWLPLVASGLVLGQAAAPTDDSVAWLAAAALASAPAMCRVHRQLGTALALASVAALAGAGQVRFDGIARGRSEQRIVAGPAELRGQVLAKRQLQGRGRTRAVALDLSLITPVNGLAVGEKVRLNVWSTELAWRVGDRVVARVTTLRVPRGFCNRGSDAYAEHLWRQGVVATASVTGDRPLRVESFGGSWASVSAALQAAREAIGRALERAVPDAEARAVLAALVYGDQSGVPAALRQAYAKTGTAHVLSVSGLHIAVVTVVCFAVLRQTLACWSWLALRVLVVRPAALVALVPATFYAMLSGGAVATLRSLAMAAVVLGGVVLLRRGEVWTAFATAALLLCAGEPGAAADPSFQLSFVAVAGLVAASRRFDAWRAVQESWWLDPRQVAGRMLGRVLQSLVVAVAAGVVTGPITAYHFGSVATLGVLANLVVVPLVGWLALLLGLGGALLLPVSEGASGWALEAAAGCIAPANAFVRALAATRWCALDLVLASPLDVLSALGAAFALVVPRSLLRRSLLSLVAVLLLYRAVSTAAEHVSPSLVAQFLDVGQGDAVVVRLPGPRTVIAIDGGGLGGAFDPGERVVVPALRRSGAAMVDALVISHPDFDHYGGLAAIVRALPVRELWSSGRSSPNPTYAALLGAVAARGIPHRVLVAGTKPHTQGAEVQVVHPPASFDGGSDNDASLVLRIAYGATRLLFTGDIESAGEAVVSGTPSEAAASVLKVPHHGSRTSSSGALVARVRPGLAVALLGANNRFHFPAAEVRERWQRAGARWLQSDRDGEVFLISDGQMETVRTCR